MNKITKNIAALIAFGIGTTTIGFAQIIQQKIGNNSTMINSNAALEVESSTKGLLLPRLGLTATNNVSPLAAHVAGMTVYNTATAGTGLTAVTPGYYYNDGSKWVRVATGGDAKTEPWRIENSNTEATDNSQNIYQKGNVGIGDFSSSRPITNLDVRGAIRSGLPHADELSGVSSIGSYSAAFGQDNIARGEWSFAGAGLRNYSLGDSSVTLGQDNEASGGISIAIGNSNFAKGGWDAAIGTSNTTNGPYSTALGNGLSVSAYASTAVGRSNAITTGYANNLLMIDPAFQVGNGYGNPGDPNFRQNAITVLNNGNTAIGVSGQEALAKPTERLDIGEGNADGGNKGSIRIRAINSAAYTGDVTTDKIVVADGTGVLKTVAVSTVAPAATEPWKIQKTTNNAVLNSDKIYQNNKVAVGDFSAVESTKQFEVKGDFKSQTTVNGNLAGMEVNTPVLAGLEASGSYWATPSLANANIIVATKDDARATSTAPGKISNFQVSPDAVNVYSKHGAVGGEGQQATLQLNGNDGRFALYANRYDQNWGAMVKAEDANGLLLYHAGSNAAANVNDNDRTEIIIKKADGITFQHNKADGTLSGSYKFPVTRGSTGQVLSLSGSADGRLNWTTPATIPTEPWKIIGSTAPGTSATLNTDNIYQMGNVAIGATTIPNVMSGVTVLSTPKFHVVGDVSITGKYYTTNSVYADYVFEKYFHGRSDINPNYEFKSLNYVKEFIKANNHLPGVESIADLAKAENGYTFDMTKLTVQSLEKIEELYLHTIEQQDKIDAQGQEIIEMKERLERLEKKLLQE